MRYREGDFQVSERKFGDVLLRDHCGPADHCRLADGRGAAHLCFLVDGAFTERRGSQSVTRAAGSVRLSPAGDLHDVVFGSHGGRCLMVQLPEPAVPIIDGPTFRESPELTGLCLDVLREFHEPGPASALAVEASAQELFAVIRRQGRKRFRDRPHWLPRVRELLQDSRAEVPRLDALANLAGVHPVHLARAFRECMGCTVGEYARRVRVRRVVQEISRSGSGLARIAVEHGYVDQSHMSREVKRVTGHTPGELRRGC